MPRWEVRIDDGVAELTLKDTLGIADAGALRHALLELVSRDVPVTVECSGLVHIDCAVAQVLIAFAAAMRRRRCALTWGPLPDGPREYLALTGLLEQVTNAAVAEEVHA